LQPFLEGAGLDVAKGPPAAVVAGLLRERAATLAEMAEQAAYFYRAPVPGPEVAAQVTAKNRAALEDVARRLRKAAWTREAIGAALKAVATESKLKAGEVMMPVRWLVSGTSHTPAIDAVLEVLGRDEAVARLDRGLLPA
jgi:glutamyl-tRNA synthetase